MRTIGHPSDCAGHGVAGRMRSKICSTLAKGAHWTVGTARS